MSCLAQIQLYDVHTIAPEMPAMFDGMKLAAVATVLYFLVRCLNLKSPTAPPDITYQDTPLNRYLLKSCPILTKEYIPPLLWGKSGHLQTDGATATFDLFELLGDHRTGDDICPGIGNHSEKHYIRTFVNHSQRQGYRCAVLNHLGSLPNIELTSPGMFTYGCTCEFAAMVGSIKRAFPQTLFIVVGFSLGGNIVCKFLEENRINQERVLCCVSVCQGYSTLSALVLRIQSQVSLISSHQLPVTHRQSSVAHQSPISPNQKTHLLLFPYPITSPFPWFKNPVSCLSRLFCSSLHLSISKPNVIFALTLHGGHLGFFEGAVLFPQPLTWMDKVIVGYANAICQWERQTALPEDTSRTLSIGQR
uniref:Abhydrolase domain containing 2, acylglycerol lipase b n=1 Tax=Hucho hucho TaxID=62062 RepID=A0A4W5PRZ4_9TELE